MSKPKAVVAVVIRGGNVIDVVADIEADVYILDYDNPVLDDHPRQRFTPSVGSEKLRRVFKQWDDTAEEQRGWCDDPH